MEDVQGIQYANNRPNPGAKVLADVLAEAALRFNRSQDQLECRLDDGSLLTFEDALSMPLEPSLEARKMFLTVSQADGNKTTYEVELEFNKS